VHNLVGQKAKLTLLFDSEWYRVSLLSWFVYILECSDQSLYTGITTNVERRLQEHNGDNKKGARYTRARRPVNLVYKVACEDRAKASQLEYKLKNLSRTEKLSLLKQSAVL